MQKKKITLASERVLTPKANVTLASHRAYLSQPHKIQLHDIRVGDVIRFMYDGEERTVFVLNPEYQTKLHGLSLKAIDHRTMMVEVFAKQDLYKTPHDFYARVISREVIQDTDSYRTYNVRKMANIHRMKYYIDDQGREEL